MFQKKLFGISYAAWNETFLMIVLFLACNFAFSDGQRWIHVSLNPLWMVVLLISAQYGTLAGLMSVMASTLALYVGNLPEQKLQETFFDYQLRLAFLPGLFCVMAFLLGEIRRGLEDKNQALDAQLKDMMAQAERVVSGYEKLKSSKEYQELSVASQRRTAAALYQTFKYLEVLNPAHILRDLDKIIVTAMNPKKFSVYAWGGNGFEAATSYGWESSDHFLSRIPTGHPIYVEVAEKRRLLCVVNEQDEKILSGQGLMAAPLVDTESQQIFGLIKIEAVHFLEFNLPTLEIFKTLCELIGIAYSHARKFKGLSQQVIYGRYPGLYSHFYYKVQEPILQKLAAATQMPLTRIGLSILTMEAKEVTDAQQEALIKLILAEIHEPAQLFDAPKGSFNYFILLPSASKGQAEALAFQLIEKIQKQDVFNGLVCSQKVEMLFCPMAKSPAINPIISGKG